MEEVVDRGSKVRYASIKASSCDVVTRLECCEARATRSRTKATAFMMPRRAIATAFVQSRVARTPQFESRVKGERTTWSTRTDGEKAKLWTCDGGRSDAVVPFRSELNTRSRTPSNINNEQ